MLKFLKRLVVVLLVATVALVVYRQVFKGSFPWDSIQLSKTTSKSVTTQNTDGSPSVSSTLQADPQRYLVYSTLSTDNRTLYATLLTGVEAHSDKITFSAHSAADVKQCFEALLDDHPDIFWTDGAYTYTGRDDSSVTSLAPHYLLDEDTMRQRRSAIEQKADAFLATLSSTTDDYDKALAIHDHVVDSTTYDLAEYQAPIQTTDSDDYDIRGVLLDGKAVCQGYAKAYQYLMQREGLYCAYVTGTATDSLGTTGHAWNMVRIDGTYSYVDCTFDDPLDPDDTSAQQVSHAYFCIGDSLLFADHTPDGSLTLPVCETITRP